MNTLIIVVVVVICLLSISSSYMSYMMVKYSPPPAQITTTPMPQPIVTPQIVTTPEIVTTTLPPSPTVPVEETSSKLNRIMDDINTQFAWKSMKNAGDRDVNDLKFTKTCSVPWNGVYQVGCTIDGVTAKSNIYGPINDGNNQSPVLRIGAYGNNNLCSKLGGRLSIYRQRPSENTMTDITQYLTDTTNTKPYNKKDPIFLDDYKADC